MDDSTAVAAMAAAMGSPLGVSGAAHLPDYIAARFDGVKEAEASTVCRVEGVSASVAHCIAGWKRVVRPFGTFATLNEAESRVLWRSVRDVQPFWADGPCGERALWRIATAPAKSCEV